MLPLLQKVSSIKNPNLPYRPHGWFRWHEQFDLLLREKKPKCCVEIGVWTGLSALFTARKIAEWGGYLVAVDTWNGFVPVPGDPLCEEIAPSCLDQFISNTYFEDLQNSVFILKGSSNDLGQMVKPDWVYLDGNHEYQDTLNDLKNMWKLILPGGIILGDDFGMDGVFRAWRDTFSDSLEYKDQLVWMEKPLES